MHIIYRIFFYSTLNIKKIYSEYKMKIIKKFYQIIIIYLKMTDNTLSNFKEFFCQNKFENLKFKI